MKVNLGCGQLPLDGYHNVDAFCAEADERADVFNLSDTHWQNLDEIRMDHMLEHVGFAAGGELLRRCRCWLRDEGVLVVEVPDMDAIMRRGIVPPWQAYLWGSQQHGGEFHLSGYTADTLRWTLEQFGYRVETVEAFLSDNRNRPGMPCLKAVAVA
jgi:predicted SAM-dependent methyltransferase